ncbi:DUF6714 family protein [Trinickia sp.]|uniref:DUF6714 family protein n=1 Tax=Trinickia sp. TaxID=2571163 RepID=UPI003F80609C
MIIDFSVFSNVKFPANEAISTGGGIESRGVETFFRDRARFDVTLRELNEDYPHDPSACLGFMLPAAFAFFLPLFMKISIVDFDDADVISDTVVYRLRDMGMGKAEDNLRSIMHSYTHAQMQVVLDFLSEMSEIEWKFHNPDVALIAHGCLRDKFKLKNRM